MSEKKGEHLIRFDIPGRGATVGIVSTPELAFIRGYFLVFPLAGGDIGDENALLEGKRLVVVSDPSQVAAFKSLKGIHNSVTGPPQISADVTIDAIMQLLEGAAEESGFFVSKIKNEGEKFDRDCWLWMNTLFSVMVDIYKRFPDTIDWFLEFDSNDNVPKMYRRINDILDRARSLIFPAESYLLGMLERGFSEGLESMPDHC